MTTRKLTRRGWLAGCGAALASIGLVGARSLRAAPPAGGPTTAAAPFVTAPLAAAPANAGRPNAAPPVAGVPSPVGADRSAQDAHARASCGRLGPGTGLRDGRGWVVSMLPGKHRFRLRGGGRVFVTTARLEEVDFDIGRPYYIALEGAARGAVLEWKTPGRDWEPVGTTFLYPPTA